MSDTMNRSAARAQAASDALPDAREKRRRERDSLCLCCGDRLGTYEIRTRQAFCSSHCKSSLMGREAQAWELPEGYSRGARGWGQPFGGDREDRWRQDRGQIFTPEGAEIWASLDHHKDHWSLSASCFETPATPEGQERVVHDPTAYDERMACVGFSHSRGAKGLASAIKRLRKKADPQWEASRRLKEAHEGLTRQLSAQGEALRFMGFKVRAPKGGQARLDLPKKALKGEAYLWDGTLARDGLVDLDLRDLSLAQVSLILKALQA